MTMLLAGDIGATKTVLRLVNSEKSDHDNKIPKQTTLYEQAYPSQEFPILFRWLTNLNKKQSKL